MPIRQLSASTINRIAAGQQHFRILPLERRQAQPATRPDRTIAGRNRSSITRSAGEPSARESRWPRWAQPSLAGVPNAPEKAMSASGLRARGSFSRPGNSSGSASGSPW